MNLAQQGVAPSPSLLHAAGAQGAAHPPFGEIGPMFGVMGPPRAVVATKVMIGISGPEQKGGL